MSQILTNIRNFLYTETQAHVTQRFVTFYISAL